MDEQQNIIIYRTADGRSSVALFAKDGKIWLNQQQMAEFFATSKPNISLHRSEVRWDEPAPNMKEIFKHGDVVKVIICRIDHEQGRIFFSIKRLNMKHIADIYKAGSVHKGRIASATDKLVKLEFPYEVKAQTRAIRFAKVGIKPTEGETIDVRVLSYSPEDNEVKFALDSGQAG